MYLINYFANLKQLEMVVCKITRLQNLILTNNSSENNGYVELMNAIELYSKSIEEYSFDWILLNIIRSLEALGNFANSININSVVVSIFIRYLREFQLVYYIIFGYNMEISFYKICKGIE